VKQKPIRLAEVLQALVLALRKKDADAELEAANGLERFLSSGLEVDDESEDEVTTPEAQDSMAGRSSPGVQRPAAGRAMPRTIAGERARGVRSDRQPEVGPTRVRKFGR